MVNVVFLHPDLGIGGAERLVVDAALALQSKGHSVQFITNHHDKYHCFEETKNGTFPVTVVGDWLPRSIFGVAYALCAYLRMIYAALYLVFFCDIQPDVIFCDQISHCIPVLQIRFKHILFYCHFPDQLLSKPGGFLKKIYRFPLNYLEEWTTSKADVLLVNSKFTRSVFKSTFSNIVITPHVLYPSINTDFFDGASPEPLASVLGIDIPSNAFVFLSLNRYERKKDHGLALKALDKLRSLLPKELFESVHLIVAGGYDRRVSENVDCYAQLVVEADILKISHHVVFLKSPSDSQKLALLLGCHCLLYTPVNEHFGIVPLEAMYSSKPVIATLTGGPMETVVDNVTGYLKSPEPISFANGMADLVKNRHLVKQFGETGKKRFKDHFSFKAFSDELNAIILDLLKK